MLLRGFYYFSLFQIIRQFRFPRRLSDLHDKRVRILQVYIQKSHMLA